MTPEHPIAAIIGVQLHDVDDAEHQSSLAELGRLAHTLGYKVVVKISQRRRQLSPAAVLGEGKLRELAQYTGGTGVVPSGAPVKKRRNDAVDDEAEHADIDEDLRALVDDESPEITDDSDDGSEVPTDAPVVTVVLVDHDISPSQARNLEQATGAQVLDRTAVILEIFHRHARSREARLQVEIARLGYLAPRLRETGTGDRQRGGIGMKGSGETSIELDRRKIRDRIAALRLELASISRDQGNRRTRRSEHLRVALVGYTNAGKSSLMRALTGSEVYVADKLFATLDTTVRTLQPESHPRVLVSDTVGFIKKLPHDLVASFRSTLDEAREASLLLHVVDAADAAFRAQLLVTREVLEEIGAGDVPSMLVLNKCDRIDDRARELLALEYPDAVQVSAHRPEDVKRLREALLAHFERDLVERTVSIPFKRMGVLSDVHSLGRVLNEDWDERGVTVTLRAPEAAHGRIEAMLKEDEAEELKDEEKPEES